MPGPRRFAVVAFAALIVGLVGPKAVAAPPTPVTIFAPDCTLGGGPGALINTPGTYRLTVSVFNCKADPMVQITASNVVFDLNGGMLDGDDLACGKAIEVVGTLAVPLTKVTIKNGTVRDCTTGIDAETFVTKATLTDLTIRSTGTGSGALLGSSSTFTRNVVVDSDKYGLSAGNSNLITKNTFAGNTDWALLAGGSNKVIGNTFSNNTSDAMFVTGNSNLFKSNTVNGNGGDGICVMGATNKIIANIVKGNVGSGIDASEDGNIVKGNTSVGNEGAGIEIEDASHSVISSTKILSNRANGNLGAGIVLVDPLDGLTPTTIKGNTANGNAAKGIAVTPGPLPGVAHKNKASGNIGSPQCDATLC